jgi:ribonuclease J
MACLIFYGGVGEIGGNKILLDDNKTRIFLDFGMSFAKKGKFYEEYLQPRTNNGLRDLLRLGIVPKIDGIYRGDLLRIDGIEEVIKGLGGNSECLWSNDVKSYTEIEKGIGKPTIDGVLISHAHADHFQHISLLDERIPIYCSEETRHVIEATEEVGRGGFENEFLIVKKRHLGRFGRKGYFPGEYKIDTKTSMRKFVTFQHGVKFRIGDIEITPIPVDHSVPGTSSFLIKTSDRKEIIYTGDLRFHGYLSHLTERFRKLVKDSEPDALIIEGTRIGEDMPDSEAEVRRQCGELVVRSRGLVMVGFAWKDVTRFQTMKGVAMETGRTLVVSPKLAYLINKLNLDPSGAKVYLGRKMSLLYSKGDYVNTKYDIGYSVKWDKEDPSTIRTEHFESGVRAYEIQRRPTKYLLHLDFYDFNELIDLEPPDGSIYICAHSEPFNLEMELDEVRLRNWLAHFKINPPDYKPYYIHASGHASGPEIKSLIRSINPKALFPIHTEHPDSFEELARRVVIPKEGETHCL